MGFLELRDGYDGYLLGEIRARNMKLAEGC